MKREDAEEFTHSLGQIVGGSWRQIDLAKRLGVPQALGLSTKQWVNERLGGYVKQTVEERRKAVAELSAVGRSTRDIAKAVGVGKSQVSRDLAAPNGTHEALSSPETVPNGTDPINAVAALAASDSVRTAAKANETRQANVAARAAEFQTPVDGVVPGFHFGDFRVESPKHVPDESVELVFVDPPYDMESIDLFGAAAAEARRVLKPNGSMLCYCGQLQLPQVIPLMLEHLSWWWICQHHHDGGPYARMNEYGIIVHGKPMLWLVKGTRGEKYKFVHDGVLVKREKDFHPWQQAESIASYYIKELTPEGGTVVDFFAGGGTTLIAADKLGRKRIGFESDPKHYKSASARLTALRKDAV